MRVLDVTVLLPDLIVGSTSIFTGLGDLRWAPKPGETNLDCRLILLKLDFTLLTVDGVPRDLLVVGRVGVLTGSLSISKVSCWSSLEALKNSVMIKSMSI